MVRGVYLVRDTAVGAFLVPLFFVAEGEARRAFADWTNKPSSESMIYQHPEHFQLYLAGEYDDVSGLFTLLPAPEFLVDAVSVAIRDR